MADDGRITVDGKVLHDLRVIDLKKELEKRGLSKSGSKHELVKRLKAQLMLERLQSLPVEEEGTVPNIKLQNDEVAGQNDFVKQYLEQQQKAYEVQRKAKEKIIEEEERLRLSQSESETEGGDTTGDSPTKAQSAAVAKPSAKPQSAAAVKVRKEQEEAAPAEEKQTQHRNKKSSSSDSADRPPELSPEPAVTLPQEKDIPLPPPTREKDIPLPPPLPPSVESADPPPPPVDIPLPALVEKDIPLPPKESQAQDIDIPLPPPELVPENKDIPLPPTESSSKEGDSTTLKPGEENIPLPPADPVRETEDIPLPPAEEEKDKVSSSKESSTEDKSPPQLARESTEVPQASPSPPHLPLETAAEEKAAPETPAEEPPADPTPADPTPADPVPASHSSSVDIRSEESSTSLPTEGATETADPTSQKQTRGRRRLRRWDRSSKENTAAETSAETPPPVLSAEIIETDKPKEEKDQPEPGTEDAKVDKEASSEMVTMGDQSEVKPEVKAELPVAPEKPEEPISEKSGKKLASQESDEMITQTNTQQTEADVEMAETKEKEDKTEDSSQKAKRSRSNSPQQKRKPRSSVKERSRARSSSSSSSSRSRSRSKSADKSSSDSRSKSRSRSKSVSRSRSPSRSRSRSASRSGDSSSSSESESDSETKPKLKGVVNKYPLAKRARRASDEGVKVTSSHAEAGDDERNEADSPMDTSDDHVKVKSGRVEESFHTAPEDTSVELDPSSSFVSVKEETPMKTTSNQSVASEGTDDKSITKESEEKTAGDVSSAVPTPASSQEQIDRPARKRRWGSTRSTSTNKKPSFNISTDSLKGLIPEIKTVPTLEAEVDIGTNGGQVSDHEEDKKELKDLTIKRTVTQVVPDNSDRGDDQEVSLEVTHIKVKEEFPQEDTRTVVEKKGPKLTRHLSQQKSLVGAEDPEPPRRSPSPARNPVSKVVHIRNLVRPFTLGQLKELLGRTGSLVEDAFWIDKIKSHCIVTYEDEEGAKKTRLALHGTKWPSSNPKNLRVEYASQDELEFHRGGAQPIRREMKKENIAPVIKQERRDSNRDEGKREVIRKEERRPKTPPVREWDRDKIVQRSRSRSREVDRSRERVRVQADRSRERSRSRERRRARSGEGRDRREKPVEKKAEVDEAPAKLLDDLFRKTKASPCIYWLPLTEEQISKKQQERAAREQEREKRRQQMEESKEAERKQRIKAREERRKQEEKERAERRNNESSKSRQARSRSRSRSRGGRSGSRGGRSGSRGARKR